MYDQIFDDFNTIKQHCERNGNDKFEESAVFELLENLYPVYGSVQAVQTIVDMLDAQRVRDANSILDKCKEELSDSRHSGTEDENDDIIEIQVPKKVHPFIDLTENSTESDEAVIIEKPDSKNIIENVEINSDSNQENNDSEASCHEVHSLSDSDASKQYNEDSNLTIDEVIRSNSEKQMINYLAILDQSDQINQSGGEQSNNDSADVSEMLEENNNDPNNNFNEEANANQSIINHHSNASNILDGNEPPNPDKVLDDLFNGMFDPIPIPGCSKEATFNMEPSYDANKPASDYNFLNPVPGCSKNQDFSHDNETFGSDDDSIEQDIACIQEIIPWAASDKIRCLLLKYNHLSDRKQLTLLKLMKEDSIGMKAHAVKRKSDDAPEVESKVPKVGSVYTLDDSIGTLPNFISDESSNDSESSEYSGNVDAAFKMNLQASRDTGFPDTTSAKNSSHFDNTFDSPFVLANANIPVFSNSSSNMPMKNQSIKKERNETVVSGLLKEQKHLEMLNGTNVNGKSTSTPSNNFSNQSINEPFFPNSIDFQFPLENNLSNHQSNPRTIEKTVKEEADNILNEVPRINGFVNSAKSTPNPNQDRLVIQPPKLLLPNSVIAAAPQKMNFMRPAVLNFNNSQQNNHIATIAEQKDGIKANLIGPERLHVSYPARQHDYKPPPLRVVQKQAPIPSRIHYAPSVTITRENQAEPKASDITTHAVNGAIRKKLPVSRVQKSVDGSGKVGHVLVESQKKPVPDNPVIQPGTSRMSSGPASTSNGILDQKIYNKLRSIFPEVESSYIKKICINPPNINNTNDRAYVLNALIEHLLTEGSNHLCPVEYVIDQPNIAAVSVDEKYEYLLGIFPDADPTYIRDFVVKNPSEQDFEQFIQEKLESHDYPTKEQYMARIKITEQIKQYTTELNIDKFLELFPDPFKHFEDSSRKCTYQPIAMEFLKSLFVRNKVLTITHQYKNNKYNLSLTAKSLATIGTDMKSKRTSVEMLTEDIPLLQEMAFIKNKQNIFNHLNMLKNKEEQLFHDLKEQNLLLTCQCCFNDECMPTKSSECNEGHVFCHECIIRGTESALANAEANVRCFTECQSEFSLATLQKVLPPTSFSALLKKRQTAEVIAAGVDGLVSCPFCHFASIPPPEDKVFKCLNPECMKETCKLCKELNHVPLKCDEVIKTDKARRILEEKMTEALVRTCYNCKKQFYKEDGCNKMKCTCGALMCYLCSKPIKGYDHFNAQGGANTHLCPLWSDDRVLNAKAVIKVAEDVKKVLLKNNPDLKIDTEALLPKIPHKTRGPHDDIPNADQLPEHIMRIANAAQR